MNSNTHLISTSYSAIAPEYYNKEKHPTCYNFSILSQSFITNQLATLSINHKVLELGAGRSSVAPIMQKMGCSLENLVITDASKEMLSHSFQWKNLGANLEIAEANQIIYPNDFFDYIVASLADPYNDSHLWSTISRLLKPHGHVILTLPSFEWAIRFRGNKVTEALHSAEFRLSNGTILQVPSLVLPLSQQIAMIESSGLMLSMFQSLGLDSLQNCTPSPKVQVFGGKASSLIWGFTALKAPPGEVPLRQTSCRPDRIGTQGR